MAISDIFSSSFLFSIGIIIILIGGIFAYVSYRMGEQDHKLNSMIALISTMAEESRFFRSKIATLQQKIDSSDLPDVDKIQYASQIMGGQQLIDVSDDEDEDEYEDEDEDEDENENEDENEDEDVEDNDSKQLEKDIDESDNDDDNNDAIKLLNLSFANDNNIDEINDVLDIEQFSELKEEIKTVHLENPIVLEDTEDIELKEHEFAEALNEDMSFLKNVSITNLGEEDTNKPDYKKMSLNKLRDIVVSKGLVIDASKFKKNDLLKLLDDE